MTAGLRIGVLLGMRSEAELLAPDRVALQKLIRKED